jgi:hypothetical protein
LEAAGIEPASKFSATSKHEMTRVICPSCGAALALQDSGTNSHVLALDDRLRNIIRSLPHLPDQMLRIVEAACLQPVSRGVSSTDDVAKNEFPPPRERAIDLSTSD